MKNCSIFEFAILYKLSDLLWERLEMLPHPENHKGSQGFFMDDSQQYLISLGVSVAWSVMRFIN